MTADRRNAAIGVALTIIGAIAFSAKTVIIKLAYQYDVDVLTLLALRMMFALPLFLIMAWWAGGGGAPVSRRDAYTLVGLGFIGYYLGSYLDFAGLQYISAGLGRLILYLYPTLVLILSAVFLKQPISARHLVSLALSYGGIALALQHEIAIGEDMSRMALGSLLVFGGAVCYAVYLITGGGLVQRLGSMRFTAYASIPASLFVIAHFMVMRGPARLAVAHEVYFLALIMAVFSTVLPLWLLAEGLKRIGANQSSLVACIGPLATIVFAAMFLGEPITSIQLAGALLVLAGIMIISLKPRGAAADSVVK
jgi:drug/metabolite transporter (DMT)-like permease